MQTFESHLIAPRYSPPDSIDRALQCMAGFFTREDDAAAAVRRLLDEHHLTASQVLLLAPRDRSRLRFARLARAWARRKPIAGQSEIADRVLGALAGSVLGGVATALWITLDMTEWQSDPEASWSLPLALMFGGIVLAAALGAGLVQWFDGTHRPLRFNGSVKRQLAAGHWAVVVHNVPWPRQADVLNTIQRSSQLWSASAQRMQRL